MTRRRERGATTVEYGVLLALLTAVLLVALAYLGRTSSSTLECASYNAHGAFCTNSNPPPGCIPSGNNPKKCNI